MITFKKFLEEIQYEEIALKKALNIIDEKCKNAMWMILENEPIYRGDKKTPFKNGEIGFTIVDPANSERMSAHTTNYYTLIMDNTPSMQKFPKRSKSIVCTTYSSKARDFAGSNTPLYIIPFDNTPIGVVNQDDLWDVEISLFGGRHRNIDRLNNLWRELGMSFNNNTWQSWIDFAEYCKGRRKQDYYDDITEAIKRCRFDDMLRSTPVEDIAENFLELIDKAYSPHEMGISLATTANRNIFSQKTEVWVGGPCLVVSENAWQEIVKHYSKDFEE